MASELSFLTPIKFKEEKNCSQKTLEFVDRYLYLGGRSVEVLNITADNQVQYRLIDSPQPWYLVAIKIISYMTIIFPLIALIVKQVLRSKYDFTTTNIMSIDSLINALIDPKQVDETKMIGFRKDPEKKDIFEFVATGNNNKETKIGNVRIPPDKLPSVRAAQWAHNQRAYSIEKGEKPIEIISTEQFIAKLNEATEIPSTADVAIEQVRGDFYNLTLDGEVVAIKIRIPPEKLAIVKSAISTHNDSMLLKKLEDRSSKMSPKISIDILKKYLINGVYSKKCVTLEQHTETTYLVSADESFKFKIDLPTKEEEEEIRAIIAAHNKKIQFGKELLQTYHHVSIAKFKRDLEGIYLYNCVSLQQDHPSGIYLIHIDLRLSSGEKSTFRIDILTKEEEENIRAIIAAHNEKVQSDPQSEDKMFRRAGELGNLFF